VIATLAYFRARDDEPAGDQIVILRDVTWEDYKRVLAMRGDRAGPRLAFDNGCLQIMSPSREHESIKSWIGCLLEVFCLERGIPFRTYGSWTLQNKPKKKALEPDECYVFIAPKKGPPRRPDLAIEAVWTSGGLDKLDIYRALRVPEVWYWRKGVITQYGLSRGRYVPIEESAFVPGIDLVQLCSFLDREWTSEAIVAYRKALLRSKHRRR
jgi:Uma2 family endonuclease